MKLNSNNLVMFRFFQQVLICNFMFLSGIQILDTAAVNMLVFLCFNPLKREFGKYNGTVYMQL